MISSLARNLMLDRHVMAATIEESKSAAGEWRILLCEYARATRKEPAHLLAGLNSKHR